MQPKPLKTLIQNVDKEKRKGRNGDGGWKYKLAMLGIVEESISTVSTITGKKKGNRKDHRYLDFLIHAGKTNKQDRMDPD